MAGNRDGRHLRGVYGHGCLLYGYLAASRYGMNQKASSQDEIIPNCNQGARACVVCDVDVCLTWVSFFANAACLPALGTCMNASYACLVSSLYTMVNPSCRRACFPFPLPIPYPFLPNPYPHALQTFFSTHLISPHIHTHTLSQAPSTSALFFAKNSLNHFNGFSGSCVARCFIASSKYGVTC